MGFGLDCGRKPGYYFRGEGESTCKGKISVQLKPWHIADFSSNIFLAQASLKSRINCVRNFNNLGYNY